MLLAEPLFACAVGVAAIVLVVITAPLWTAAASQLGQLIWRLVTRAGRTVDQFIRDDKSKDKGVEDKE